MNRLWVRFSLIISSFFLVLILLPLGTVFVLDQMQVINISNDEPTNDPEDDGFAVRDLPEVLVGITAIVGLIGVGLGIWLSRGLTTPITELADAAKQIGAGDLSHRVPVQGQSRELIDLAQSFNDMASELQHAETLRSNLLADVSHELRTPLTALAGQLRAGLDHVFELDEAEIANLYGQTQFLIRLVEDLRLLAQAEARQLPLHVTDVSLPDFWHEIALNFTPLTEEKMVRFLLELSADLPPISADPLRLRQIFTNLLANALRHTPAGGTIIVQASLQANTVVLTIADDGDGVAPEHISHLFDRFYRTDHSRNRETGGTGLGLAIVKALVEEHGGQISATSPGIDQGSTFTLCFPTPLKHS